jgi:hypothetical protein
MPGQSSATINFGITPVDGGTFTITDASISPTSVVEAFIQHGDTTSDNNTDDHSMAAASFRLSAAPGSGNFTLEVILLFWQVTGTFKIRYAWV